MNNNIRNQETVCAVVVTYNRKNLLLECLEAIRKQTRPVDAIYLIDNASTDKTPELLMEKGYISELPPKGLKEPWEKEFEINNLVDGKPIKLYYVRMHENTGGAGGFYEGIKRGYKKGYDWVWLMDDDAEPYSYTLEKLLEYTHKLNNKIGFLAPVVYGLDGNTQYYHHKKLDRFLNEIKYFLSAIELQKNEIIPLDANCFVGPLISREAIKIAGFPIKELFYYGDDLEYTYRITRKLNGYLITKSSILHKDYNSKRKISGKERDSLVNYWRNYYGIRNVIFIKKKYLSNNRKLIFFSKIFILFIRKILRIILFDDHKVKRIQITLKAYYDGIGGRLGKIIHVSN